MSNDRPASAPILISSLGLAERDQRALKLVIEFVVDRNVACRYIGDGKFGGHIVVVDLDSDEGHEGVNKLRPGQVKILFSKKRIVGKNIVTLITPIRFDVLKNIVIKICTQIQSQLSARSQKRIETERIIEELSNEKEAPLNDGPNIFNVLFDAKKTKSCLRVTVESMPVILVNGADGTLATDAGIEKLQQILSLNSNKIDAKMVSPIDVPSTPTGIVSISPLDNALWLAGLSWRSGELLDDFSVDDVVKLKAWPNFTRNNFTPNHLKLSAALSAQAMSLRNLNAITQVPLNDIIRFFNACYAIDLVDMDVSSSETENIVIEKKKINNKRRSLLFRLANRLGFG